MAPHGKWEDRWLAHPFPTMGEPEKAVAYLTDFGDYDEDHRAWLYNKASLHGVNSFFNQVRRPIHSKTNRGRIRNGYSPYDPGRMRRKTSKSAIRRSMRVAKARQRNRSFAALGRPVVEKASDNTIGRTSKNILKPHLKQRSRAFWFSPLLLAPRPAPHLNVNAAQRAGETLAS